MRPPSVFFACTLAIAVAGAAAAQDDVLTDFWRNARAKVQPRSMAAQNSVATITRVGLEFGTTTRELLAKAQPDECFTSVGGPTSAPPCGGDSQPKVNQSYVWGMVDAGSDIWFGTVANTHCFVLSTMIGQALSGPIPPLKTPSWVCEFGGAVYDPVGDQRPPEIKVWHSTTGILEDKVPDMTSDGGALLAQVIGLRSAGTSGGVVLLAGVMVTGQVGIFAFETDGTYIGEMEMPWTDVRRFAVLNDELYVGVGTATEGQVLRWTGDVASPFAFETVAAFAGEQAAEVVAHEGRLAVGTWPIPGDLPPNIGGVHISPDPGGDGVLDSGDGAWSKIWSIADYEPDPVNSAVTGVGAMASYGGNLYWGTMHPPLLSAAANWGAYSSFYDDVQAAGGSIGRFVIAALLGNHRATTFWMGENVGSSPDISMLYGLPELPVFTPGPMPPPPSTPVASDYWVIIPTGWTPEWGPSGFGNAYNTYTWATTVNNGRLWVGTMDWLYLLQDAIMALVQGILDSRGITLDEFSGIIQQDFGTSNLPEAISSVLTDDIELLTRAGADLYYFLDPDGPAYPESWGGIDNYTSYGVRNMVTLDDVIFVGMANPMNLLTDPADKVPEGGWELIQLEDLPPNTNQGFQKWVFLDDGTLIRFCEVQEPGHTMGIWLPLAGLPALIPPLPAHSRTNEVMLVATSAQFVACSPDVQVEICLPSTTTNDHIVQLQTMPDSTPGWVNITTKRRGDLVCGTIRTDNQDLMADLGYWGYLGIIGLQQLHVIPDAGPLAHALLVVLIALAALVVIRMRAG